LNGICTECKASLKQEDCKNCVNYAYYGNQCTHCSTFTNANPCGQCKNYFFVRSPCRPCELATNQSDCLRCSTYSYVYVNSSKSCINCFNTVDMIECSFCSGFSFINSACRRCTTYNTLEDCLTCPNFYFDSDK
jgi:hypothetical protein